MLISTEAHQAYVDVLLRAQAYMVCASVHNPVDVKPLHAELVVLYKFRLLNDSVEVRKRVEKIHGIIDKGLESCTQEEKMDLVRFVYEVRNDILTNPRVEKEEQGSVENIDQETTNVVKANETSTKTKKCSKCKKAKPLSSYYAGKYMCKTCFNNEISVRKHKKWLSEHVEEKKLILQYLDTLSVGDTFTLAQVAEQTGVCNPNYRTVYSIIYDEIKANHVERTTRKKGDNILYKKLKCL